MRGLQAGAVVLAAALAIVPMSGRGIDDQSGAADVQLQLGDLLYAEGRFQDALQAYQRADTVAPRGLRLRVRMGIVRCAQRVGDFDLSYEQAMQLPGLAPASAEAMALYGDSLWAAGLFDESERAFAHALALDARDPRAHFGAARAAASRSRLDLAVEEARAAVRLAPRDPELYFLLGTLYERVRRFHDAADTLDTYVSLLPERDRSERSIWSRAEIRLLRSFGDRVPSEIEPASARRYHVVPFSLVHGKVMVKVRVNGKRLLEMAVDTGAEHTVLSQRTADRLNLSPITYGISAGVGEIGLRGLQVGRLDSLEIGPLAIRNVRCLVKTPALEELPKEEADSFSPLALGLSMTVDYRRRQLTLGPRVVDQPADFELPLRLDRLATVRGTVNEAHPGSFVVDTGGEVISINSHTAQVLSPQPSGRRIPLRVWGVSGWDRTAYLLPGVRLAFDAIRFPDMSVVVLDLRAPSLLLGYRIGGILGHHFLNRYRVDIDLPRSVLRLTRS
jgi:tetratricopeptide (TPR) repeat protein